MNKCPPSLLCIEEISQEESRPSSLVHLRELHLYLVPPSHNPTQSPLSHSPLFNLFLSFPQ